MENRVAFKTMNEDPWDQRVTRVGTQDKTRASVNLGNPFVGLQILNGELVVSSSSSAITGSCRPKLAIPGLCICPVSLPSFAEYLHLPPTP